MSYHAAAGPRGVGSASVQPKPRLHSRNGFDEDLKFRVTVNEHDHWVVASALPYQHAKGSKHVLVWTPVRFNRYSLPWLRGRLPRLLSEISLMAGTPGDEE